jgi:HPt (histidine-containing phosphotransfer) domain-containing protein
MLARQEIDMNLPTSPHAAAAVVPLDAGAQARLRELDPEGRHGVVVRVLQAYEGSLKRMLGQLQAQREGGSDAAVIVALVHTLKSSSASVGALALAALCAEVEARLRADPGVLQPADVQHLLAEGESALRSVAAMLRP